MSQFRSCSRNLVIERLMHHDASWTVMHFQCRYYQASSTLGVANLGFFLNFLIIKQDIFAMFLTLELFCHLDVVTFGFKNLLLKRFAIF